MHVRVNITTGASNIDEVVRFLDEQVLPDVRQQKGFAGMTAAGNRESGRVTVLTMWETEEDRDASEGLSEKARNEAHRVFGGDYRVERYEQVLFEMGDVPPGPGAKLHVREVKADPARIDEHVAYFREQVLPDMKASPGFLGVRQLVNRATGEGRVGSVWADEAALRSRLERTADRRATATERGIEFGDDYVMDVLLARS